MEYPLNKVQFIHNRKDLDSNYFVLNGTFALEITDKTFLEKLFITHSNITLFKAGISIMSKKDKFIKKKGREVAVERINIVKCEFESVHQDGTTHIYNFYTNELLHDGKYYHANFSLTTVSESENVRLISAYLSPTAY